MNELNDFFKAMAEAKATDPKHKKMAEVKEHIKEDLGGLFTQISEIKAQDPVAQKAKKIEAQVKTSIKEDLGSLFAELGSLKVQKDAILEERPELAEPKLEEPEVVNEEVLIEVAPIEEVPQPVNVDKYLTGKTFQQPEPDPVAKEFKTITDKMKFLEQAIAKIAATGPGSGEVNLRYLDDVDRSSIGDGKYLNYNATTKKFQFSTLSGGGAPQVQSDWTQSDNTEPSFIKNKPSLFSGDYNDLDNLPSLVTSYTQLTDLPSLFSGSYTDLTNKPTIPAAQIQSDWNQTTNTALDYIKNKPTIPDITVIQETLAATGEPMGHADKTQSTIAFNNSTRTFSISPVSASFDVWVKGTKFTISSTQSVTIPNTTGLYYIYFNTAGTLQYRTTFFDWGEDCMTAYVYWNSGTSKAPFVADERHGITLDWQTHEYLHRTRGAAIANGFDATNYTVGADGSSDTHLQIDISSGTFFDEDLQVDIVSTNTPTANTWEQDLTGPSKIPMMYLNGNGAWVLDTPTTFPIKQGTLPKFNSYSGGVWTTPDIDNNKFGVTFIIATNNINYPVIGVIGQAQRANIGDAEATNFSDLNLTGFPVVEMRPLYKLVYDCKSSYTNSVNARLVSVWDLRSFESTTSALATYTDHGALGGLSDDDHPQYLLRTATESLSVISNTSSALGWRTTSPSPGASYQTLFSAIDGVATISTSTGLPNLQTVKSWSFDTSGHLTFPDSTVQSSAWTGTYSYTDLTDKPTLFSGAYADLTNKPTLFSGAGSALTGSSLASGITSSSLTSLGTLTSATINYVPSTTTGQALTITAKDTQGGTGYADFLKVTNTTSGATNANKTLRLNNSGGIEIINSAYTAILLTLTDTGALNVASSISVGGKKAVNGPSFRAYVDGGQTIAQGAQRKVTFGGETFDTDGCFASSKFIPNVEGYYQLNATVRISGTSGTGECMIILYKNGTEYARGNNESGAEQGNNFYSMQVSDIAYANGSTDNFEIYIQQSSGADRTTTAGAAISYFSGCMIRGA